jgi:hypothetical protein
MLLSRPKLPTTTINLGLVISGGETILPIASRKMDTHSATRNTPLMSAPRISARCHPYELADDEGEVASLIVYRATMRESTSLWCGVSDPDDSKTQTDIRAPRSADTTTRITWIRRLVLT